MYSELSHRIIGAAIEVHRHLGPGQLESVYERALAQELAFREIPHRTQVPITVHYKGCCVGEFFADLIVDDKIVVELKAVTALHAVHVAQTLSYLDAAGLRLGLLINFNVPVLCQACAAIDSVRRLRANDPENAKSSSRWHLPPLPLRRLVIPSWPICIVGRERHITAMGSCRSRSTALTEQHYP